jgi:hypothetical protein
MSNVFLTKKLLFFNRSLKRMLTEALQPSGSSFLLTQRAAAASVEWAEVTELDTDRSEQLNYNISKYKQFSRACFVCYRFSPF